MEGRKLDFLLIANLREAQIVLLYSHTKGERKYSQLNEIEVPVTM
jgi:hypothetical protein